MNTTKTAQFTPVCICQAVREYYDTGIGGMFEDKVKLCPFHTAAPAMYEAVQLAAMSYHHPACKCKGEYAANPERYCTCHVQIARAALAQAEGKG